MRNQSMQERRRPPDTHPMKVHVATWSEGHGLSRDIWLASDDGMRQSFDQRLVPRT